MKNNKQMKPEHWPPLLKQLEIVNSHRHVGTIRSGIFMIHTMLKQFVYTIYIYNAEKDFFEKIGKYRFIDEDSLSYRFAEVESTLSNIDIHEITLPKICSDRYFFQAESFMEDSDIQSES